MKNRVFLKIHSFDCTIEAINEILNLKPNKAWLKGEINDVANKLLKRTDSLWEIQSNVPEHRPIDEHIEFMFKIVKEREDGLKYLTSKYECEFTINSKCDKIEDFNYGIYMSNENMRLISDIGLNLDIDVYFLL
jgi:pyruvate kinase